MLALLLAVLALLVGVPERESLEPSHPLGVPHWIEEQALPPAAVPGARVFVESGCLACHTYMGDGSPNLGAPDLTAEGRLGKGLEYQIEHLKCPSCTDPGSQMPSFAALPEDQLRELAVFLEASKGDEKG